MLSPVSSTLVARTARKRCNAAPERRRVSASIRPPPPPPPHPPPPQPLPRCQARTDFERFCAKVLLDCVYLSRPTAHAHESYLELRPFQPL